MLFSRISIRSVIDPPKNCVSVRTETPEAPSLKYPDVTSSTADDELIIPFDGDFLLNSAIIPVLFLSDRNPERDIVSRLKKTTSFQISDSGHSGKKAYLCLLNCNYFIKNGHGCNSMSLTNDL